MKPSTADAAAFFAQYRERQTEQRDSAAAAVLTQALEKQRADIQTIVPMNKNEKTASFRLKVLQLSPKNCSPALMSNSPQSVLPPTSNAMKSRITLVLDIDETLVHSSYEKKPNMTYDLTLVVQHEGQSHTVYVRYRPFLSEFLAFVGDRFEVVIFTASVSPYCHALMDKLDPRRKLGSLRLCREHCTMRQKSFIKDLFLLGRDLSRIAIIDNSPTAYLFQQRNAIPITSWFDDPADQELIKLFPMLAKLAECTSVYDVLDQFNALGVAKDE